MKKTNYARRNTELVLSIHAESGEKQDRTRDRFEARNLSCSWAVRELGQTATSLAKRLGLTQAGVSKAVLRGEMVVKEMDLTLPNR